jgi:hypothetical protein
VSTIVVTTSVSNIQITHAVHNLLPVQAPGPQGPPGPQGEPGAAGAAGGTSHHHVQAAPAATWIIEHSLSRPVHTTIISVGNEVVYADVVHGTPDQTTIAFAEPTAGTALLS